MNNEKQRIAIAEARGMIGPFENSEEWFENGDSDGCIIVLRDATGKRVADYLTDLNAMHEAEKVLTFEQQTDYMHSLATTDTLHIPPNTLSLNEAWYLTHATAAQRAEAFLRTIGKWEAET